MILIVLNGPEEIEILLTHKRVNIHNDNSYGEDFTKTSNEENIKTSQKM